MALWLNDEGYAEESNDAQAAVDIIPPNSLSNTPIPIPKPLQNLSEAQRTGNSLVCVTPPPLTLFRTCLCAHPNPPNTSNSRYC